jgi:HEAT repeat protein
MNSLQNAPYIGLRPFKEEERDRFFGRRREISILLDKIRANRLTLLLAASGVGKSSLLQAGIMPALRADGNTELIYHRDWAALPQVFKQAVSSHYGEPYKDVPLKSILRACTLFSGGQQILLLDQFEEFFNYHRFRQEFLPFVEELSAAILDRSTPASFVLSMREDFALELNAFKPFLPGVFDNYFRLEKLTREQARQAIEEPLKPTGWCFEPEQGGRTALLEQVLDDLAKREQERQFGVQELLALKELPLLVEPPHLQIVCQELWLHHRDEAAKQISHAAYDKAGGTKGILEDYFLRKIALFSQREQRLASAAFDHLIGQRATKIAHPLDRLAELTGFQEPELGPVLDKLQDAAILRRQQRDRVFWYELYHDIFSESIDKWNREFKHQQRVKRLAVGTAALFLAGGLLFAGNNWRANQYGRYVQLSTHDNDLIKVYQGTQSGFDIFHQRKFLYETPFFRREIEADRMFSKIPVKENADAQQDFISRLPISDRFSVYMTNGFYETGYQLAERIAHTNNDSERIAKQIRQFSSVRTLKIAQRLVPLLGESNAAEVQQAAIQALAALHINKAVPKLRELLKEKNADVQAAALKALAVLDDENIVSHITAIIKQVGKDDWSLQSAVDQVVGILKQAEAIPAIKILLQEKNPNARAAAIKALTVLHADEAVPEIKSLLNDEDSYVSETAIQFLESLHRKEAIPEFRNLMLNKEPYVQEAAIKSLGSLRDKEMISEVRKLLFDRNTDVRAAAIKFLAALNDKEELPAIIKFIRDRDSSVKRAALEVLADMHVNEAIPEIEKIINDNDRWATETAIKAITELHYIEAIPKIKKMLYGWETSGEAIDSLATFRDEKSSSSIRAWLYFNTYSWIKPTAIKALATLHDSESISEIRKLTLAEIPYSQVAAVESLGAFHNQESIPEIRRFLDSGVPDLQKAAVTALGVLHDYAAVPVIRSLADNGDWKVQATAIQALGMLNDNESVSVINKRLADRYIDIQLAAAQALARLDHSSPQLLAWQQKQLETAAEKAVSEYPDERKEAAKNLASIFSPQSVKLLDKLMDDTEKSVAMPAVESLGIIGEYAPGLLQKQVPKLFTLTNHDHLDMQEEAVNALGRLISFRGKEKAADYTETDQRIRSAFRAFILDQEPKNSFRRTVAADALGTTGRQECAHDFESLLKELKDDPRYYRCLYWMKRLETDNLSGDALQEKLQSELEQLTAEKELWRQKRNKNREPTSTDVAFVSNTAQDKDAWRMEQIEHLLGNALARIAPAERGIALLDHPLHQVRQGAVRALAGKASATLISKIIQAHQDFNPDDLPSPFPYTAFQAIDLALWNLEYTGTKDDLATLQDILNNLQPCKIPGQEGAIEERLEWTIKRLGERFATD